jgi:hypothetical protein
MTRRVRIPHGLKPIFSSPNVRGPEGPLFHGRLRIISSRIFKGVLAGIFEDIVESLPKNISLSLPKTSHRAAFQILNV